MILEAILNCTPYWAFQNKPQSYERAGTKFNLPKRHPLSTHREQRQLDFKSIPRVIVRISQANLTSAFSARAHTKPLQQKAHFAYFLNQLNYARQQLIVSQ